MTDSILTTFVERTRADPALAQDLLDATDWNLEAAVSAYHGLYDTQAVEPQEYQYDPKDFEMLADVPEDVDTFSPEDSISRNIVSNPVVDDNEAQRRHLVKHQREKRGRGLSFLAKDVVDKFNKVAVSTEKVSAKEQVTFDEKFFHHSFIYPDFSGEEEDLQEFIAADLIEVSMKRALERLGRLNWWTRTGTLPSLEPLATSGDGNCLLHAASLSMWGFHDRELILRTALHRTLTTGVEKEGIKRRWMYHMQRRYDEIGLKFSDEEWNFEWQDVIRIATNQPRQQPTTASLRRKSSLKLSYESLEEIHVFALAHVLKRAIIVISDRTIKNHSGEDLAPIYFGGIYLPFEVNPTACHKSPIVLGYDSSHFAPLVAKEDKKSEVQQKKGRFAKVSGRKDTVVPLVTPDGSLLPVQFVFDPKKKLVREKFAKCELPPGEFPDEITRLLESYLDVRWIQLKVDSVVSSVERSRSLTQEDAGQDYDHLLPIKVPKVRFPAAHIKQEAQPIYQKELVEKYIEHVRGRYEEQCALRAKREEEKKRREDNLLVPCITEGCEMFGKKATGNLCSMCYKATQVRKRDIEVLSASNEEDKEFVDPKKMRGPAQDTPTGYQWPVSDSPQETHRQLPKQTGPSFSRDPTPHSGSTTASSPSPQPSPTKSTVSKTQPSPSKLPGKKTDTPPPQASPSRKTNTSSKVPLMPPNSSGGSASTTAAVDSSSSSRETKGTGSKGGNGRKLKIIPSSPLKKPPKVTKGYSRDGIQPISLGNTTTVEVSVSSGGSSRVSCKNAGCEFFGSQNRDGYCSKCYSELSNSNLYNL